MEMPHWPIPPWQKNIKYDLENITKLLEKLGNPHLKLPPVIHIAGTNGKGSSAAMFKSIFKVAGLKVHAYTSPHLIEFNERIVLANERISDNYLFEICEKARLASLSIDLEPSFFEGTTAAAFLAFSQIPADILILETGLGGRLDATNVVPKPLLTLITPISYDHMDSLGPTLPLIAGEKAGIIKSDVPCAISCQTNEVYEVLLAKCYEVGAPAFCYEYDFGIRPLSKPSYARGFAGDVESKTGAYIGVRENSSTASTHKSLAEVEFRKRSIKSMQKNNNSFLYLSKTVNLEFPAPSLLGDHQLINAATVIAGIGLINKQFNITKSAISTGLKNTIWPARIERIDPVKYQHLTPNNRPLSKIAYAEEFAGDLERRTKAHLNVYEDSSPKLTSKSSAGIKFQKRPNVQIWVDGAHNSGGAQVLAHWLKDNLKSPIYLILGMTKNRNVEDFCAHFKGLITGGYGVRVMSEPSSYSAEVLSARANSSGINFYPAESLEEAIIKISLLGQGNVNIIVTGSLFLAADFYKLTP